MKKHVAFGDVDSCLLPRQAGEYLDGLCRNHHKPVTRRYEDTPEKLGSLCKRDCIHEETMGKFTPEQPGLQPKSYARL